MPITKCLMMIFFTASLSDEIRSHPEVDWFDSVTTRLGHHRVVHTAFIVHQPTLDDHDEVKNALFKKILASIPSVVVEVNDGIIELEELEFGAVSNSSTSLMFIFYANYSGDREQIYKAMNAMYKLTDFSVNYVLIVLRTSSNVTSDIENFLQHAWNKSMSNVLIVENNLAISTQILAKGSTADETFRGCEKLKCYGAIDQIDDYRSAKVIIHQFNFFTNLFYHQEFQHKIEFFPNFANNMHGYKMKIFFEFPNPYSRGFDKSVALTIANRADLKVVQTMMHKLNFTVFDDFNETSIDHNILFVSTTMNFDPTSTNGYHLSEQIMTRELILVMPNVYRLDKNLINHTLVRMALSLVIIALVWLLAILLKFDTKIWSLFTILGLILSFTVHHQPSRLSQRILFIAAVIVGIMYSNDIYNTLINLGLDPHVDYEYKTLEQIDQSGLSLVVYRSHLENVFKEADGAKLKLKDKAVPTDSELFCIEKAIEDGNVSCLITKYNLELYQRSNCLQDLPDSYKKKPLKIAEPIFGYETVNIWFRQGLPAARIINGILHRCREAGLLNFWYSDYDPPQVNYVDKDSSSKKIYEQSKIQMVKVFIVVALLGNFLAVIVFAGELLVHRCKKSG